MRILVLSLILTLSGCADKSSADFNSKVSRDASANPSEAVDLSGHEVGNGGDAIVCKSSYPDLGGGRSGLLDYYEARKVRGWTINFQGAHNVGERVTLAISRLKKLDPDRAALYLDYAASFSDEAQLIPDLYLPNLPDDGPVSLPGADCEVRQLAIQRKPSMFGDKRYVIDEGIWTGLDDDSKAGLILHEIIYRETVDLGHKTSAAARYLNALLASNAISRLSRNAYAELLEKKLLMPAGVSVNPPPIVQEQEKECLSAFGQTVCGYNCLKSIAAIKCASDPGAICLESYGRIECGFDCKEAYGNIKCAKTSKGRCDVSFGQITCVD